MVDPLPRAVVETPVRRTNTYEELFSQSVPPGCSGRVALPDGRTPHSPVEVVEIVLCYQPEVDPNKKKKEGCAEDEEPHALPL